jgi:Malectin domain
MNSLVDLASEKQELDAMVERLARSPRLAHLLRYMGDRYFRGEVSMLREFEIATEVFGRRQDFDPSEDAIARVEAHRLRKKLKFYYDTEGRANPIQITIPSGTYTPTFTHRDPPSPSEPTRLTEQPQPIEVPLPVQPAHFRPRNSWPWLALGLAFLSLCGIILSWRSQARQSKLAASPAPRVSQENAHAAAVSDSSAPGAGIVDKTIRIIAGYEGQPHIDPAGHTWQSDRFFLRGGEWRGEQGFTARTNDEFLFRTVRTGEFEYNIPLSPGSYELHLFFNEMGFGPGLGGGEGSRAFNVVANGQTVLAGFDIESDAMGPNIADERVIRDVGPEPDGKLHLEFEGVSGKPIINAIEILPGLPRKQLPIRLTAQPTSFIDRAGNVWTPDNYFLGGQSSLEKPPVTGTPDPGLFAKERWGHFSYALPVDPRGSYTLTLYFAEFYFGPDLVGKGGVGSRLFNVLCNGSALLHDFDIFKEAGSLHAVGKTFHHLRATAQGKLNLTFEPISNYANISAIEVVDESN